MNSSKYSKRYQFAAISIVILSVIISIFSISDYGMSWDEKFRFKNADQKLDYYLGLFSGESESILPPKDNYPGLFDIPLAIIHRLFPEFGTRSQKGHVWSLFFGYLGILSAWRLSARIGGERAGMWALLLLIATPRYYGHMFMNPKDIPLAGTYLLGIWALVCLFQNMPKPKLHYIIWVGIAAGLSLSTRIAGALILCYLGLFLFLFLAMNCIEDARKRESSVRHFLVSDVPYWSLRVVLAGGISVSILFIFWPALHTNPFLHASTSIGAVQDFSWNAYVLMDGEFRRARDLPFYYIPYWLFYTLPEHILLCLGIGVFCGIPIALGLKREWSLRSLKSRLPLFIVVFSGVFPIAYLLIKDPVLYDGMRHFLFSVPPFVCISALILEYLLRVFERMGKTLITLFTQIGMAASVALVLMQMFSLHPYQYTYFNSLRGGLPGAYTNDETDYWGLSQKEAGEWLNEFVEEVDPDGQRLFKVHMVHAEWMLEEALNDRFVITPSPENADFFVSLTRMNFHLTYPEEEVIHIVERQGVPLCFVFKFQQE